MYYSGGTLILDHGHRLSSSFLHLSKLLVAVGDTVQKGQKIAEVGSGGRSTGPHLDWRMNWKGERVDPLTILDVLPINP
jgi:murein DD-endopeptidase MepM/ murein hydrolase activator NlpD